MARQFIAQDGKFISIQKNIIPDKIWVKVKTFQERIKALYLLKQKDKYGIKSLGNEIRSDSDITKIFEDCTEGLLVKSTRNRSEIEKLHVSSVTRCLEEELDAIYYVMLSSDLRQSSQIFDSTSMNIESWKNSISQFHNVFKPKFDLNIFIIEIDYFTGCYFERNPLNPAYSRLTESDNV